MTDISISGWVSGPGNNKKLNWALKVKQKLIAIIKMIYRGPKRSEVELPAQTKMTRLLHGKTQFPSGGEFARNYGLVKTYRLPHKLSISGSCKQHHHHEEESVLRPGRCEKSFAISLLAIQEMSTIITEAQKEQYLSCGCAHLSFLRVPKNK